MSTGATTSSANLKKQLQISEGLSLVPYQRTYTSATGRKYKDKFTIGYGNTYYENGVKVKAGDKAITQQRAEQLFNYVLASNFEQQVKQAYGKTLNQNQFDALTHYVYNTGSFDNDFLIITKGYLKRQYLQEQVFAFWVQSRVSPNHVLIDDLVIRRQYEANLFLNTNLVTGTLSKVPVTNSSTYTVQDTPKPQDAYLINDNEQTLTDFCKKNGILMNPDDLLNYKDNSTNIFKSYTDSQKALNKQAVINLVGPVAKIRVPLNQIKSQSIYTLLNQTIIYNTDYNAFIGSEIKKLINNRNYQKLNINNSDIKYGSVFKRQDALLVWLWCKSTEDGTGRLIDITNYIENISTNTTKDGANFSITLPFITYNRQGLDFITTVQKNQDKNVNNYISKNSSHFIAIENQLTLIAHQGRNADQTLRDKVNDIGVSGQYWKRKNSYFTSLIQNNDLIFIQFEKIKLDQHRNKKNNQNQSNDYLSNKVLPGSIFDLIGLVDACQETSTAENANINNTLRGRDLSKLLIDDGTYFFPVEYAAKNSESIIKNSSKRKSGRRLIINADQSKTDKNVENYNYNFGDINPDLQFNFTKTQTIKEWIVFIFSQLTNIQICPDAVFNAYKDKTFIVTSNNLDDDTSTITYKTIQANGAWIIVKLILDDSISNRRIADSSLVTDTGSLLNLIRKVCPEPWCDFTMDTYGDKYYFKLRKPPFSLESFKTNKCVNIFEDDIINQTLDYTNEVYTWYKLNPYNSIFGNDDTASSLILFPAVCFPEYMDVWGSKVLEVSSNFIDFDGSVTDQSEQNLNLINSQALEDMDWLIETNAYLPFTRTGSITIKADRRIKQGMNVRSYGTGEVFYVDAVAQNRTCGETVDGYTTLSVSRGMIEKHLEKYFKIIKLRKNSANPNMKKWNQPSTGDVWTVNTKIFNFFLNKLQND